MSPGQTLKNTEEATFPQAEDLISAFPCLLYVNGTAHLREVRSWSAPPPTHTLARAHTHTCTSLRDTHTRCSVAHAPAPPALALTPPTFVFWKRLLTPVHSWRSGEPERVWLASEFTRGAGEGPGSIGVAPCTPGPELSPRGEGGRTKVSNGRPRDTLHSAGIVLFAGWSRRRRERLPRLALLPLTWPPETLRTRGREGGGTAHTSKLSPWPTNCQYWASEISPGDSGFWQPFGFTSDTEYQTTVLGNRWQ